MVDLKSEFFVALPSNSSMNYFPNNTQSSYRTKLHSPLYLSGDWEVGLTECFIPRNWFNIGEHNNSYTISIETEKIEIEYSRQYDISFTYNPSNDRYPSFFLVHFRMFSFTSNSENSVKFVYNQSNGIVQIQIHPGFELHLTQNHSSTLLFMLYLRARDTVIKKTTEFDFRPSQVIGRGQTFKILNTNPISVINHEIPFPELMEYSEFSGDKTKYFWLGPLIRNIRHLQLQDYLNITYIPYKKELEFKVFKRAELVISWEKSASLLHMLDQTENIVITDSRKFIIDPLLKVSAEDSIDLIIKEYSPKKLWKKKY